MVFVCCDGAVVDSLNFLFCFFLFRFCACFFFILVLRSTHALSMRLKKKSYRRDGHFLFRFCFRFLFFKYV